MNQIDLFSGKEGGVENNSSTMKDKRPPNISVSKVYSNNQKWKQCKIIGKNISIRSYSASCTFNNRFYIYGGYQILNGPLQDFYSICLSDDEPTFIWEQIFAKGEEKPGPRSKHALVSGKSKIYLIGGLLKNTTPSNQIFEYDPPSNQWKKLKPEGEELPLIESFATTYVNSGEQQKIIIAFGFNENKALLSNMVYEYNITKNRMSILFEGAPADNKNVPIPRIGCAMTTDNSNLYIFGGKDQSQRLNDIWSFSLSDFKFTRLKDEGQVPVVRNGHTMNHFQGKLFMFGGIHDITWELDDLHIYDIKTNKWTTLEQDSPRKIDRKAVLKEEAPQQKDLDRKGSKKKSWYETHSAGIKKQNLSSPTRNFSITYNEDGNNRGQSPGKMLDEQRRKVFYHKKAQMLKSFEVPKTEKEKLVTLQTSSQAMKNSLDVIGNPDPKSKVQEERLTDFGKQSVSKFLGPLQNNSNIMIGKKPCARDGHCGVIIGEELVIFGGDRHQMSFNDIFKLNLKMAEKEAPA